MMSVTMTPISPLFADSEYYYYCENAIDLTGNAQQNAASYFFTGNGAVTTEPTLVQANPPNGMTNVPVNTGEGPWNSSSLNLLFSAPVATESLTNITLTPQGGSPIGLAGARCHGEKHLAAVGGQAFRPLEWRAAGTA